MHSTIWTRADSKWLRSIKKKKKKLGKKFEKNEQVKQWIANFCYCEVFFGRRLLRKSCFRERTLDNIVCVRVSERGWGCIHQSLIIFLLFSQWEMCDYKWRDAVCFVCAKVTVVPGVKCQKSFQNAARWVLRLLQPFGRTKNANWFVEVTLRATMILFRVRTVWLYAAAPCYSSVRLTDFVYCEHKDRETLDSSEEAQKASSVYLL